MLDNLMVGKETFGGRFCNAAACCCCCSRNSLRLRLLVSSWQSWDVGKSGGGRLQKKPLKKAQKSAKNSRFWLNIPQPLTLECIISRNSLLRIKREHFIEQIQGRVRHVCKFLAQSPPILFLRLQWVEMRQFYDIWPHSRRRRSTKPRNDLQLQWLRTALKECLLRKELAKNATNWPHVDWWTVSKGTRKVLNFE